MLQNNKSKKQAEMLSNLYGRGLSADQYQRALLNESMINYHDFDLAHPFEIGGKHYPAMIFENHAKTPEELQEHYDAYGDCDSYESWVEQGCPYYGM